MGRINRQRYLAVVPDPTCPLRDRGSLVIGIARKFDVLCSPELMDHLQIMIGDPIELVSEIVASLDEVPAVIGMEHLERIR